jgi:hypothetical protein
LNLWVDELPSTGMDIQDDQHAGNGPSATRPESRCPVAFPTTDD